LWKTINENKSAPDRITAVCLEPIGIETSQRNSPHDIMGEKTSIGFTVATAALDPGFQYATSRTSSSVNSTNDLFVHLSFFAHSNVSDEAGPVYLSLYWSEPDDNWALSRMFTDALLKINTLF